MDFKNMTLYSEFAPKQRRTIKRDLDLICSLKGFFTPKTIDDLEELGSFPPKIKVNKKDVFFSKQGTVALRRISDFISVTVDSSHLYKLVRSM